jgi:DNA-binding transcriptional MerR regulator
MFKIIKKEKEMKAMKKRDYYWAQEVAEKFGVSKKTLFIWERGGKISKIPKDWRGWRMYNESHLRQVAKVIEEKKRSVR